MNMDRLSDEEMIDYYSKLIAGLGGKVTAYYLDGIAVYNHGVISSFMDNMAAQKNGLFYMIDKASSKRFEGWPLDSLSINKENGKYFVDGSIDAYSARTAHPFQRNGAPFRFRLSKAQQVY